jgi:hypothetical protein
MALAEPARGGEAVRSCEEEGDAFLAWRGLREQPQCRTEPLRGACRRERCSCLAGLAQNGDCGEVSSTRRALDVVSAGRRARSARGERFGATLVRA